MPPVTRLYDKYSNTVISLYIPESYNNETLKDLGQKINKSFPHVDRYKLPSISFSLSMEMILYEDLSSLNISLDEYCNYVSITGKMLDIYHIILNNQITSFIDNIIAEHYENELKNSPLNNNDYNKIITRRKCSNKDNIICPLSMDIIKQNQMVAETPCGHLFSSKELRTWLTNKCIAPVCPVCRAHMFNYI